MMDIVPAVGGTRKKGKAGRSASHNVLKSEWKLPARLRRPLRDEKKKGSSSPFKVEKRELRTSHAAGRPPRFNKDDHYVKTSAEHHTGDVYMKSRPELLLSMPPYRGRGFKKSSAISGSGRYVVGGGERGSRARAQRGGSRQDKVVKPEARSYIKPTIKNKGLDFATNKKVVGAKVVEKVNFKKKELGEVEVEENGVSRGSGSLAEYEAGVRDVPYRFEGGGADQGRGLVMGGQGDEEETEKASGPVEIKSEVVKEKSLIIPRGKIQGVWEARHLLGNRFSRGASEIWRWFDFRNFREAWPKAVVHAAIFFVLSLVVWGGAYNLNQLGKGVLIWGGMSEAVNQAYEDILGAQAAMAETDLVGSEQKFLQAQQKLLQAQEEMEEALSLSTVIIQYLDVTGTVKSGEELLVSGQELSRAGQYLASGMSCLTALGDQEEEEKKSVPVCLEEMISKLELSGQALDKARASLGKVDSVLLPDEIRDKVDSLERVVIEARELLMVVSENSDALRALLGIDREKQYLLLFQNNHEIRPTGGFIGSVGLVDVDWGKVEEIDIKSVYDPDGQLNKFIIPPEPLSPITNRWYMRDANWFVDYELSAKKIAQFFEKEGGPTVDGVIALNPEVVRGFLSLVGPVEMPEYGVTVDKNNFWEVTQDQVSYSYDKELNRPKQFIADLAPEVINRLLAGSGRDVWKIMEVMNQAIEQKNLLVYFRDKNLQEKIKELGWSGGLPEDEPGLLMVNNANIGGHKSDQFVSQEIDYRLTVGGGGDLDVFVTVRRTHNGPTEGADLDYPDKENPAVKDNVIWQRVLVSEEAELIEARGFSSRADVSDYVVSEEGVDLEPDADVFEWQSSQETHASGTVIGFESGYKYFANWQVTPPGETTIGIYHYRIKEGARVPNIIDPAESFGVYVAKQPGDDRTNLRVEIEVPSDMEIVYAVPEGGVTWGEDNKVIYRGKLSKDLLFGLVYESGA
jgi:hypothetical protein